MKKILFFVFALAAFSLADAQMVITFSAEQEKFVRELEQYMTMNKSPQNIERVDEWQKMLKSGKFPPSYIPAMVTTTNVMGGRNMAPAPHFYQYLTAVVNAAKAAKTDAQFNEWNAWVVQIVKAQKKGDNSDFLKVMEFSNSFFAEGALSSSTSKSWKVASADYKLSVVDGVPRVTFPQTTLTGYSHTDSIFITQTSGDYLPTENKWEGKSGKVDWGKVKLDASKVYATFKNYNVNFNNYTYTIDTVTFNYPEYFKTPVIGKLSDKIVAGGDSTGLRYPRFESYEGGITIKDIAPNVSYTGTFGLYGSKVMGTGTADEKAMLTFYTKDGKTKVMSAKSPSISIKKGEELGAANAEVSIYFGTDSIYHPQLNVVYKVQKREVRLLRGETALSQAKFYDSYHKHEFQTDAIFWNLDSTILNLKILSGVGQKPGIYESANYFSKEVIRKQQGLASYEPLSILKRLYEKTGSKEMNATEVARALDPKLTEVQARSIFYELIENGFIAYDEGKGIVTLKDKAINYVLANAKKIDYDIIRIKSAPSKGNDYIDLANNNIDLKGVTDVPISDTAFVYFQPANNSISLQKDRNMEFDGLIYAGRMDMFGKKHKFNYTPFTIDLKQVDTLRINVQDSNKVDGYGNPILKQLRSRIENVKGMLEIDAPINKSGRTRLPQFPRLYSREKSNIFYDDSTVAKGAYNRKNFYFELEPFRLDSLNNFSGDILNLQGKLVSGGIFPDIKDSVKIQADGSLGFKSETPPGGYDLYKGKGKYYGKYELNYNGMQADGRIIHSTADFVSHDIKLYPDSMMGTTDSFTIKKTFEGVKTPSVVGLSDKIYWRPNSDSMQISMTDPAKPFVMYDDSFTTFKGSLMLTSKGLRGNGTLDWDEATLESTDFALKTMDLSADTASLNIKTTGDRVTFKTPNVNAKVNFDTRIGDFKSNQKNIPTDFSYNQYNTNINEFKWFMDEKILDFKAPPQGPGEYFTSTNPAQKGLNFLGKRAIYYLVTSLLRIEGVPEIKVADASVVPDSGLVIIEGEAKMRQLTNAKIFADTITKTHKIFNATVDIFSKTELKGFGDLPYETKGIKEVIALSDISTKRSTTGKKKKEEEQFQLVARAQIDSSKNFVIYPEVKFHGDMVLTSVRPLLNFKGYTKLGFKHPLAYSTDFLISQDVDPNNLAIQFDTSKNSAGAKVMAGINLNQGDEKSTMYTSLMAPKLDNKDNSLFKTLGIITQLPTGEYLMGSEKKIKEGAIRGNLMRYDDKKGTVKAEGKFSLGANFGIIKYNTAGYADVKLDSMLYKFNLTFGIDLRLEDKMQERFEFYMAGDNIDMPDIAYDTEKQKKVITELSNEKDDKKTLEDFNATGLFNKRLKALDHNIIFNDVDFVFDTADYILRSTGKIGVAMIGKKVINKKLEGYIEIQYKGGYDVFTIYLQTGTKEWFYFEYHPGTLGVLSSYADFNNLLGAVAPDKRKIKGANDKFYLYTIGSSANKAEFMAYMKDKQAGVYHPRSEPQMEMFEAPDSSGTDMRLFETDSNNYEQQLRREQEEQLTPDQKEDIKIQREINEMERMRMSGKSILSGPPPDRIKKEELKPAAEPAKEEVPVEEFKDEPKSETPKGDADVIVGEPEAPAKGKKKGKQEETPAEQPKTEPAPEQPKAEPAKEAPKEEPKADAPSNNNDVIVGEPESDTPTKGKKKKGKQEEIPTEEPK